MLTSSGLRRKWEPPKGVLRPIPKQTGIKHARYHPSPRLADFVEHYWSVAWDLLGQAPFRQEVLPHPSVHIVVEAGRAELAGVPTGRFIRILEGTGRVFGIKFWPGGFHPFLRMPISSLTSRTIPLDRLWGEAAERFGCALAGASDAVSVAGAERLLLERRPQPDAAVEHVRAIVQLVASDRQVLKVDDLVERIGFSKRSLQRLFSRFVGVSPKWIIQRYRLHEAVERIARGESIEWVRLALDLGYFDQPHFNRDFAKLIGQSPAQYARSIAQVKDPESG